jgi:predicted CXXCH cytochrome family protein
MTKKLCSYCHNGPESSKPFALSKSEENLCRSCHADAWKDFSKPLVHPPVSEGQCTACHAPHASNEKFLLKEDKVRLCSACHKGFEKKLLKTVVHQPVAKGQCELCHEPHSANNASMLKNNVVDLCKGCHSAQHAISHPYGKGVIDPRTGTELDCVSCHDPHSSNEKSLVLYPSDRELCLQCHKGK